MSIHLTADFWYRHESDTDQTMRQHCQMSASRFTSPQDAIEEADKLHRSGYHVQRVDVLTTCPHCEGAGRLGKAPKGTRKAKIATLPAWMLTWSDCPQCKGEGHINRQTLYTE